MDNFGVKFVFCAMKFSNMKLNYSLSNVRYYKNRSDIKHQNNIQHKAINHGSLVQPYLVNGFIDCRGIQTQNFAKIKINSKMLKNMQIFQSDHLKYQI